MEAHFAGLIAKASNHRLSVPPAPTPANVEEAAFYETVIKPLQATVYQIDAIVNAPVVTVYGPFPHPWA
jgi:hypothetical protein